MNAKQTTESMVDWLQNSYGEEFDFKKIEGAIELMLTNYKRSVLEESKGIGSVG